MNDEMEGEEHLVRSIYIGMYSPIHQTAKLTPKLVLQLTRESFPQICRWHQR